MLDHLLSARIGHHVTLPRKHALLAHGRPHGHPRVLTFGSVRLCRGCACAAVGSVIGALFNVRSITTAAILFLIGAMMSVGPLDRRLVPVARDIVRVVIGFAISGLVIMIVVPRMPALPLFAAIVAIVATVIDMLKRRVD